MARHATIIDSVTDAYGDRWDVRERRQGPGFDVLIGWPEGHRGKGAGSPRVIPTRDLAGYMARHCQRGGLETMVGELPIGRTAIKRLRRLMGLDQHHWWREREGDLATLTGAAFADRHGVSEAATCMARQRYLGISRQRPDGWWRQGQARATLTSDLPVAHVAEQLEISAGAVRRLRWMLRQQDTH